MKARWILPAIGIGLAALLTWPAANAGGGGHRDGRCILEGTWVGKNPADGRPFMETFVPDPSGRRSQFFIRGNGAPALFAQFPDVRTADAGLRGEAVRVSQDEWRFRGIVWAVTDSEDGGQDIVYIAVYEGVVTLVDCDTQEGLTVISFFLAEQDADGDGIPDDGEEPFLEVPDVPVTLRRL